jgi:hypothetical protein
MHSRKESLRSLNTLSCTGQEDSPHMRRPSPVKPMSHFTYDKPDLAPLRIRKTRGHFIGNRMKRGTRGSRPNETSRQQKPTQPGIKMIGYNPTIFMAISCFGLANPLVIRSPFCLSVKICSNLMSSC